MQKTKRLPFGLALLLLLSIVLASVCLLPTQASAAGNLFTVTSETTLAEINAVIAGSVYDGITFPSGTYTYADAGAYIVVPRGFIFETASGANVTFNNGIRFTMTSSSDVVFRGSGTINITNKAGYGLWAASAAKPNVKIQSGRLIIDSTTGYGMYLQAGSTFEMTGGYLQVSNCANGNAEGGIDFEGTKFEMTGGELKTFENGNSSFGELYFQSTATLTFGGNAVVTLSSTRAPTNIIVLSGGHMLVTGSAVVTLEASRSGKRGINAGSTASTVTVSNGGTLNVTSPTNNATSGLRRCTAIVNNGTLNVTGFAYGFDAANLWAQANAVVKSSGSTRDMGIFSGSNAIPTIDSGSVHITPASSVINGILTPLGTSKLSDAPVNTAGEALTRFDLAGLSNTSFSVAADPSDASGHPGYTYSVKANHAGTAYVWAPAVKAVFWASESGYTAQTPGDILKTTYTTRGATIAFVGGSAPAAPAAPAGKVFTGWANAVTKQKVDITAALNADMDLIPLFETAYTAQVVSGGKLESASGPTSAEYAAGASVTLVANAPAPGMKFVRWEEVSATGISFASATSATTTFTMPSANVQVRAIFESESYSYTIHFVDMAGKPILADKTGTAKYNTVINVAENKAAISGYVYDHADKDSITIGTDPSKNVLTLYYKKVETSTTQEYTVNYLAAGTGKVIKTKKVASATIGEAITAKSEAVAISGYSYDHATPSSIVVNADASKNTLNLYYTKNAEPSASPEPSPSVSPSPSPTLTPGPTEQPSIEPSPSVVPSPSLSPAPSTSVEPAPSVVPTKVKPQTPQQWQELRQDTYEAIKEAEVPILSIAGINIPLSGGGVTANVWALFNLMCVLIAIVIGIWQLINALRKNHKTEEGEAAQAKKNTKLAIILRYICIAIGPLALLIFLFTEDMRYLMVMFDGWSLPMLLLIVAQVVCIVVARIRLKRAEKE